MFDSWFLAVFFGHWTGESSSAGLPAHFFQCSVWAGGSAGPWAVLLSGEGWIRAPGRSKHSTADKWKGGFGRAPGLWASCLEPSTASCQVRHGVQVTVLIVGLTQGYRRMATLLLGVHKRPFSIYPLLLYLAGRLVCIRMHPVGGWRF